MNDGYGEQQKYSGKQTTEKTVRLTIC